MLICEPLFNMHNPPIDVVSCDTTPKNFVCIQTLEKTETSSHTLWNFSKLGNPKKHVIIIKTPLEVYKNIVPPEKYI